MSSVFLIPDPVLSPPPSPDIKPQHLPPPTSHLLPTCHTLAKKKRMAHLRHLLLLLTTSLLPHLTTSYTYPSDASAGCTLYDQGPALPGSGTHRFQIDSEFGGGQRTFLLNVPRNYRHGVPVPLILAFHGEGGDAVGFEGVTGLSGGSEEGGFGRGAVVVYPEGVNVGGSFCIFFLFPLAFHFGVGW